MVEGNGVYVFMGFGRALCLFMRVLLCRLKMSKVSELYHTT